MSFARRFPAKGLFISIHPCREFRWPCVDGSPDRSGRSGSSFLTTPAGTRHWRSRATGPDTRSGQTPLAQRLIRVSQLSSGPSRAISSRPRHQNSRRQALGCGGLGGHGCGFLNGHFSISRASTSPIPLPVDSRRSMSSRNGLLARPRRDPAHQKSLAGTMLSASLNRSSPPMSARRLASFDRRASDWTSQRPRPCSVAKAFHRSKSCRD